LSLQLSEYRLGTTYKKPGSFGVYIGEFSVPPTTAQQQILSAWDVLVIDPLQPRVMEVLCSGLYPTPPHCLARIDIHHVAGRTAQKPLVAAAEWVSAIVESSTPRLEKGCPVTGVLISNWSEDFSLPLMKEFVFFLSFLGLSVYLEVVAPTFLQESSLAEIEEVTGLVIRNATISENGEERDAFQMAEMRPTIKAFVSQACLRNFIVLVWETLEDDIQPINAVVKRCYSWSKFYSALPWIGTTSALVSAELSINQTEPFGAFDWLKELKVMEFHSKWRSNYDVGLVLRRLEAEILVN